MCMFGDEFHLLSFHRITVFVNNGFGVWFCGLVFCCWVFVVVFLFVWVFFNTTISFIEAALEFFL